MSAPQSFNLAGDSTTTAKFEAVGDSVTGKVIGLTERQSTKLGTTELDFWPDGKPKMYYSMLLQTALREEAGDDGRRSVALTGSKKSSEQSSLSAMLDAVMAATGGTEIMIGGTATVTLIGQAPPRTVGYNPRKLYAAQYIPPNQTVNLAGASAANPEPVITPLAAQAVAQAVTPVVHTTPPTPQFSAEQIEAMRQAGVDVSKFVASV